MKPKYSLIQKNKIIKDLCECIATSSKSLKTFCSEQGVPPSTVLTWLNDNKLYSDQYARAREFQADFLAEEILEISDDATNDFMTIQKGDIEYNVENKEWINRSRLRVDARKWIAAKLKPKKYSDRLDLTSDGEKLPPANIQHNIIFVDGGGND